MSWFIPSYAIICGGEWEGHGPARRRVCGKHCSQDSNQIRKKDVGLKSLGWFLKDGFVRRTGAAICRFTKECAIGLSLDRGGGAGLKVG